MVSDLDVERELARAIALRENKKYEATRDALVILAASCPDNGRIQYHAAWAHDVLGLEAEAGPHYMRALDLGLSDPKEEAGAFLGLGSTLRVLGRYQEASEVLEEAKRRFPNDRAFDVFLAMVRYNLGNHSAAMQLLLTVLADTSTDPNVSQYAQAIRYYAGCLDDRV